MCASIMKQSTTKLLQNFYNMKLRNLPRCINDVIKLGFFNPQSQISVSYRAVHSVAQANWTSTKDESREMMALWPDIVRDLTGEPRHFDIPDAVKWLAKVLQYNVPCGKKNRGLAVVYGFRTLARPEQLTEENLRLARILGWCNELLQSFFLVEDDVMDHAKTRRGQPCWYLHNNIGLCAINDGLLIENTVYQLLRMHFREHPAYLDIIEIFHDMTAKTIMGQTLDLLSTQFGQRPKFDLFTMDRYNAIVKYKTAYYSFVLPIALAMYFVGIRDTEVHRQARTILLEMGHFFQVQDDYLDCYGDPKVTGKSGQDIKEGKCSWLAVVALQRMTPAQRKVFEECYGYDDDSREAQVKQLYDDLGLPSTYAIYEEESYNIMNTHIQQISRGLPHDLFFKFLSKIYRRNA